MRKRFLSLLLILVLIISCCSVSALADNGPTEEEVYNAMIAYKEIYPEGMIFTNLHGYSWKGGLFDRGYGCAAFCFELSDAAFGDLPARIIKPVSFDEVRVGDILRVNNDQHSVTVMEKYDDHVVLAEANYNFTVHWGRTMTREEVEAADYLITRYPTDNSSSEGHDNCPSARFSDVAGPSDWSHTGIDYVLENGLFAGVSSTEFAPNDTMTRAMLVTVLWRMNGAPAPSEGNPFDDVAEDSWYRDAVVWAAENSVVAGVGERLFDPEAPVTREQIASILYSYSAQKGYDTSGRSSLRRFPDYSSISTYALVPLSWAYWEGLIAGTDEDGTTYLQPQGNATRAQVATILMNYCEKIVK